MKIIIPTIGSRGDVQPYINLSQGLQDAGHHVTIATNPSLCPLVDAHNVKSTPVGSYLDMSIIVEQIMKNTFSNMYLGAIRAMGIAAGMNEAAYPDVLMACKGADLVIVSDTGCGIAEADKLGIPWISVTLHPMLVPSDQPTLWRRILGIVENMMIFRVNRFRRRVGVPVLKGIADMQSKRLLFLPINHHVIPTDALWSKHVHQTNFWYSRLPDTWSPPQDLVDFLQAGEKPIAVNLGVMSNAGNKTDESARIVLEAIRRTGVRAVIQGWDKVSREIIPSQSIFYAGALPHNWLFDQVSAVIHHGGFGTTAAVFRAGVPGIIIPHIMDQFYWGQQVYRLGLGPKPITRDYLNVHKLERAIYRSLNDTAMKERATGLGKRIHSEPDGVVTAVSMIEKAVLINTIQEN